MECRAGENQKRWFRGDRFFCVNGEWYFSTREQTDVGPFGSESEARQGLGRYTQQINSDENHSAKLAASTAVNGRWASNLYR